MSDIVALTQCCKLLSFFYILYLLFLTKLDCPNYSDEANKVA